MYAYKAGPHSYPHQCTAQTPQYYRLETLKEYSSYTVSNH